MRSDRLKRMTLAVVVALATLAPQLAYADPPLVQSQGSNFGTASIGRVEMWVGATGGSGSYSWSIADGSLPPGVALRTDIPSYFPSGASAGLIGVATTPGSYFFTLRAASGGVNADQACTLKISALVNKENQLPDAFAGVAYSYTLSALGNVGAALWSPPSGLPAGMTLNGAGLLSGTPTSAGIYNLVFTLSDGTDTVNQGLSVNVFAIAITTPGQLPNATQNAFYTTTIAASGGEDALGFTANGLPNGLNIDFYTGEISGTVSSDDSGVGNFPVSVTASDGVVSYTKMMSIDVVGATPTVPSIVPSNSNIYDCTLGVPCYRTISVLNGGTAPFSWTATGLPPGMSIRFGSGTTTSFVAPGDAQLWGTPTAIGSFTVQLTMTDASPATVTPTFAMKVSPMLQTTFLENGTIDAPYSQTLRVVGGTGPYTVAQTAGQLPAGLTVNSGTLVLSGTPVESGNHFSPVFMYTDSASHTLQIDSSLFINDHGSGVSIYTSTLSPATDGSPYSVQFSSCCAESIVWSHIGGTLPPGLLFLQGGQLTGTPSASTSTYTFLLKAADYSNPDSYAARQFTLNVVSLRPSVTPSGTGVAPGATVTATVANGPANAGDWVALYAIGAPAASYLQSQFLNGTQTPPAAGLSGGTLAFTLPLTLGTYELRFFLSGTFTVLATSVPITVGAPSISPTATTVAPGAAVAATVANGPGTTGDWVALYATGAPAASYLQWQYLNGIHTAPTVGLNGATLTFTLPQTPGTYELRFLRNNTFTVLATSVAITVGAPSITPSATTVAAGAAVTVTVANGPATTGDWVALYATGAPAASYLQYKYLNGTHTAPSVGLSGATLTFTAPLTSGTYELRFLRNNTFTVLAISVPITDVAPPSVTPSATTLAAGAAVTATIANGPGTAGDWVALYATGAPAANYVQYQYLNGTHTAPAAGLSGATLTFTAPLTPGTYELRFFRNNTYTVLATSIAITVVAAPSITPSATTEAPGATVTATIANGPGTAGDWVALYTAGAPATALLQWRYMNGTQTAPTVGLSGATLTFTLPLTPGIYELRFFSNNTYTVLATSVPITDVAAPSITPSATAVAPGATVTATIANGPATAGDWVALYTTGAPAANYVQYQYLNGTHTAPAAGLSGATLTFTAPLTPGTYELRFFRNNTYTVLATSATITVSTPSITPSATTVAPGAAVTATIANGPATAGDWVALYATGAPAASYLQYQYLNGTQTAPAVGLTGASLTFTAPLTPGTYELRFFRNNTYTVLATSVAITVAAPSITPSATTVSPGATVTGTIANGPGTAGDWVALYATGAPAANYVQWQYMNGTQTAPATGLSGAALTFTLPLTPGIYELRFFRNNTYTVLATSATITVQ